MFGDDKNQHEITETCECHKNNPQRSQINFRKCHWGWIEWRNEKVTTASFNCVCGSPETSYSVGNRFLSFETRFRQQPENPCHRMQTCWPGISSLNYMLKMEGGRHRGCRTHFHGFCLLITFEKGHHRNRLRKLPRQGCGTACNLLDVDSMVWRFCEILMIIIRRVTALWGGSHPVTHSTPPNVEERTKK